mgnify:CR=1 FL=1
MIFRGALFGLGNVGFKYDKNVKNKSYLTHYSTIKNLDGFELIYAIDNDKKNRNEFEQITKIKTISTDELLRGNKKIDIVIIATPPKTHIDIIKKIVVLKPKVILCEKPLSLSNFETIDIIKLCSSKKINLELNYFRKFEQSAESIKKILNNISFFRATVFYSNGFINNGSHFLDLITYWFGKPKDVFLKKQNGVLEKSFKDYDLDFELNYDKGDVNFFSWKENLYSNYSIRIYTDLFKIDYDINGYKTTMCNSIEDPDYKGFKRLNKESVFIKNNLSEGFKPMYSKIYSNMKKMVKTDFDKIKIVPKIINRILKQI